MPDSPLRTRSEVAPVEVQILHVAGCPSVDDLRVQVERCLLATGRIGTFRTVEGPYASPSLRINGHEVLGAPEPGPSCRLDLPTESQILAALDRFGGPDTDRRDHGNTIPEVPGDEERRLP